GATPKSREIIMHPAANRCESCHSDTHNDQLMASSSKNAYMSCHTVIGWKPSTFSVREHASSRFPLTGRHAAIDYASCHSAKRPRLPTFPSTQTLGSANITLHLDETSYKSCHRDPHGQRYAVGSEANQQTCMN